MREPKVRGPAQVALVARPVWALRYSNSLMMPRPPGGVSMRPVASYADGGVGGVVEHLLEVGGTHGSRLVRLDGGVPPARLAVRADDGGGDQRESGHQHFLLCTRRL
jgi:hypothetical protein